MKPKLAPSLKVAHVVLRHIDLPSVIVDRASVVGYENGREHGLALRMYLPDGWLPPTQPRELIVAWAECRNSDSIVVYVGEPGEAFAYNTNIPTERAYKAAQYFSPADRSMMPVEARAAQYITTAVTAAWKAMGQRS